MKIERMSNGTSEQNEQLSQGFCKHYTKVKIGSLACQACKYFVDSVCHSRKNQPEFKKFWVVAVNNYLCDASYSGKELKAKHQFPSFRQFHLIKSAKDLNYYTQRKEITNEEFVKQCLERVEETKINS
jgi:hypothetical protein